MPLFELVVSEWRVAIESAIRVKLGRLFPFSFSLHLHYFQLFQPRVRFQEQNATARSLTVFPKTLHIIYHSVIVKRYADSIFFVLFSLFSSVFRTGKIVPKKLIVLLKGEMGYY